MQSDTHTHTHTDTHMHTHLHTHTRAHTHAHTHTHVHTHTHTHVATQSDKELILIDFIYYFAKTVYLGKSFVIMHVKMYNS